MSVPQLLSDRRALRELVQVAEAAGRPPGATIAMSLMGWVCLACGREYGRDEREFALVCHTRIGEPND